MIFPGSLHTHTEFSNETLRDCINKVPKLIDTAISLGHNVIAITDHETVSSYVKVEEYYEKVKKSNPDFKVIRGNEIYLTRNGLNASNFIKGKDKYFHFILLCKDLTGYHQVCELSSRAWKRSYIASRMRRRPTYYQDLKDVVLPNKGHLIASSACLGSQLDGFILQYKETNDESYLKTAKKWCKYIEDIFGKGNFYLELQPSNNPEQIFVNRTLIQFSKELNIPYTITLDAHYLRPEDAAIHEAFLNAEDKEREVKSFYETTYLMNDEELRSYLTYLSNEEIEEAYKNILKIKDKCEDFSIQRPLEIPTLIWRDFPEYGVMEKEKYFQLMPSLKKFESSPHKADKMLVNAVIKGIQDKEDLQNQEAYDALEECLDMTWISSEINNARWSAYYLNLQRILDECWKAGSIVLPSRGCFTPEMKVSMEDGRTKKICEVEVGDKVFTHTGEVHTVKNKFDYDVKEQLYRIKVTGTEDIICTNNHKILGIHNIPCKYSYNCVFSCKRKKCKIKEQLKPEWIEAQRLCSNDMVAIPRYKYSSKQIKEIDLAKYTEKISYCSWDENYIYTYHGNNTVRVAKKYKRFIPIDKDFLYFLGVFIGDGWVNKKENNRELGLCFNAGTEKDKKSQERIIQYLEKLNLSYQLIEGQNGKQVNQVRFVNPFLGFFLNKLCGHGAENKHIPQIFLYDNYEEMQELLWGLMNSDGSIDEKGKRLQYDTINFELANQVRNLLSYLGIYSSIKTRIPKDTREDFKNSKISYKVSASGKQLSIFPFIKFPVSKNIVQRDDNYFYPRIKEITTEEYEGKVYDLSVEKDTSYVINNIAVHNSGGGFLLLYCLDIIQMNRLKEKTPMFPWRFLNPQRVSVVDVDVDISGIKRAQVLKHLYEVYKDRICNVATFKMEKSKSAILTAARGLGISNDDAQYISSLITVERGQCYSLQTMYYGSEEDGIKPNTTFINEINKYDKLWEVASNIEGMVCGVG